MKIYISYSLSQATPAIRRYLKEVILFLQKNHTVLNANIINKDASKYKNQTTYQSLKEQQKLTKLKREADIVIVEISKQSLGIGQEIEIALNLNKPVIALHHEDANPHVLRDRKSELLILCPYNDKNLAFQVEDAINYANTCQDIRFNLFISPNMSSFLTQMSEQKKQPKSVIVRDLIQQAMQAKGSL